MTDATEQRRLLAKLSNGTDGLIRRAIIQAGFSGELAEHAELEWRQVGYFAGTALARDYRVPAHLHRFPAVHCVIRGGDRRGQLVNVGGRVCIGAGRYGIGLVAPY